MKSPLQNFNRLNGSIFDYDLVTIKELTTEPYYKTYMNSEDRKEMVKSYYVNKLSSINKDKDKEKDV